MKRDAVALVDESRCIGCTRCIAACPLDAVIGAQGLMHTVVEPWCTGCGLCPPACPVDCIDMVAPRGEWSEALQQAAGLRARRRKNRLAAAVAPASREKRRQVLAAILAKRR